MEAAKNIDNDLDPRIQIELENLNKYTDEINKLEIELDVSNFEILFDWAIVAIDFRKQILHFDYY